MLPKGWELLTATDICHSVSVGIVIKPSQYYVNEGEGVKAFRSANVREGYINDSNWVYLSKEGHEANKKSQLQVDDILVVRTGYPGTACIVTDEFAGSNAIDIVIVRPNKNIISSSYLCAFTNSEYGKSQVLNLQGGMAQQHLNVGAYQQLKVKVPPIPEQKKITRILTTWDKAIDTTEKLLANSQRQKKALMQQLLTGKKRLLDKNGKQFNAKWKSASLGKTCKFLKGYTYKSSEYSEVPTEYGFLTLKSILRGGGYSSPGIKFLADPTDDKFSVKEGDLIFAITDLTRNAEVVGAPILVPNLPYTKVFISMDLIKLEPSENVNKIYLFYLLKLRENRNFMRARASGSTVLHLDVSGVKKLILNLPCFEEQQKIAAVLSVVDEKIATIQKRIDSLVQGRKALMQQLLTGKRRVKIN